jgi:Fe-S cluster assembly protein SufD
MSSVLHVDPLASDCAVIIVDDARDQRIIADVPPGRTLTVIIITNAPGANVTLTCEGTVHERGSLLWQLATLNAATVHHTVQSTAVGAGATSTVEWLCNARNDAHWTLDVRNIFTARDGRGEVTMRGIAQDRARIVCRGIIDIRAEGTGTDTFLTQAMLMLDPSAKIDAVPALEIHTDNVRASHSATVTRISPEDLFYLSSRGIPLQEARTLYIEGFIGELADRIVDATARTTVKEAMQSFS